MMYDIPGLKVAKFYVMYMFCIQFVNSAYMYLFLIPAFMNIYSVCCPSILPPAAKFFNTQVVK
jgi:uncharacterized metal-binding protein